MTEKSRESAKAASESLNGGGSETGGEGDAVGIAKTDKDEKRKPAKKGFFFLCDKLACRRKGPF